MKKILLGAAFAMALSQVNAAPDPNFHIYLAFGQSNMEGQGDIEQQDKSVDDRFQVLWAADNGSCSGKTKGKWSTAVPPLAHCQKAWPHGLFWSYYGRKDGFTNQGGRHRGGCCRMQHPVVRQELLRKLC